MVKLNRFEALSDVGVLNRYPYLLQALWSDSGEQESCIVDHDEEALRIRLCVLFLNSILIIATIVFIYLPEVSSSAAIRYTSIR